MFNNQMENLIIKILENQKIIGPSKIFLIIIKNRYEGQLIDDKKDGQGVMTLSNGEYYIGQFKKNMVYGKGKFTKKNGSSVLGVWEKNILAFELDQDT